MKAIPEYQTAEHRILVRDISAVFALRIQSYHMENGGRDSVYGIDARNRELIRKGDLGSCASHDHCDANVFMHEAVCLVLNATEDEVSISDDQVLTLMNSAWHLTKITGFAETARAATTPQIELAQSFIRTEEDEENESDYMDSQDPAEDIPWAERNDLAPRTLPIPADVVSLLKCILAACEKGVVIDCAGAIRTILKSRGINA